MLAVLTEEVFPRPGGGEIGEWIDGGLVPSQLWRQETSAEEQAFLQQSVVQHTVTAGCQHGFHVVMMWVDKLYAWTLVVCVLSARPASRAQ